MEHSKFCAVLYNKILKAENRKKSSGMTEQSRKWGSAEDGVQLFTTFCGTNMGRLK